MNRRSDYVFNINGSLKSIKLPAVVGVLNYTPDSFYAESRHRSASSLATAAKNMAAEGAAIIDIGCASSRPGAEVIPEEDEISRAAEAVSAVRNSIPDILISIDTYRSTVAEAAINAGADIINDISGGNFDPEMLATAARRRVPIVLQHSRGTPDIMQTLTHYSDVTADVLTELNESVENAKRHGVTDIIVDPGFGFAKTAEQSFELLSNLQAFKVFGFPIMVGLSRKSMIFSTLGITPENALNGTTAANVIALMGGADLLRVHDPKEARQAIDIFLATNKNIS